MRWAATMTDVWTSREALKKYLRPLASTLNQTVRDCVVSLKTLLGPALVDDWHLRAHETELRLLD